MAIPALGDVGFKFLDVFSTFKTDSGSYSLIPFKLSVPSDNAPANFRPYHIKPILAKQAYAVLDQYLASGLTQYPTSPYFSTMVAIPNKDGNVRITVNHKTLNAISSLGEFSIPRVYEVLDSLGKGRIFSLFGLLSSFHQMTVDKYTTTLTAFCTPTRPSVLIVVPQGSRATHGLFVKIINEDIKDLQRVAAYLDDILVFDPDPASHVDIIRALFQRL